MTETIYWIKLLRAGISPAFFYAERRIKRAFLLQKMKQLFILNILREKGENYVNK